jgi:hypothetical protein
MVLKWKGLISIGLIFVFKQLVEHISFAVATAREKIDTATEE